MLINAGIEIRPESCGIFPDHGDAPEMSYHDVVTDYDSFTNYAGVEGDEQAKADILAHVNKGHMKAFESVAELSEFLDGALPVLNKIGIISKQRMGKIKKRIILDTKASFVKQCSAKHQRVILPRILDAIMQATKRHSTCTEDQSMEWFVLDFTEAFWQMPLSPQERRYYCAKLEIDGIEKFLVFLRTVQGSRGAPLSWARLAALVMRLTQSLFDIDKVSLHCFVDDPIAAIKGSAKERRTAVAAIILVWESLNFELAYKKGQSKNIRRIFVSQNLDICIFSYYLI